MKSEISLEERIKPLVEALNWVQYIQTVSSCEGHPEKDTTYGEYVPHVIFDVQHGQEREFEKLATGILSRTAPLWSAVKVGIHKRYWVLPGETLLNHNWEIEFLPFNRNAHHHDKLRDYSRAISMAVSAVQEYTHRHNNSHHRR